MALNGAFLYNASIIIIITIIIIIIAEAKLQHAMEHGVKLHHSTPINVIWEWYFLSTLR